MSDRPGYSPWGEIQSGHKLCPCVYSVSTAGHGGIMAMAETAEAVFSAPALQCAFRYRQYYCFEEGCDAPVALRELLDKKLITRFFSHDAEELAGIVDRSLQQWHPEYWSYREKANDTASEQKRGYYMAVETLEATNEGVELSDRDLEIVCAGLQGTLTDRDRYVLTRLWEMVKDGSYPDYNLYGLKDFRKDTEGNIFYKDIRVAHANLRWLGSKEAESYLRELYGWCAKSEKSGRKITYAAATLWAAQKEHPFLLPIPEKQSVLGQLQNAAHEAARQPVPEQKPRDNGAR